MIRDIFLIILALIWLGFATISDIRKREVPDWLNFSLIIFALGFRFFYGLFQGIGFDFFYQGILGFFIFFLFGNLLYYARFFAGGDAKLMIALGSILPFSDFFSVNLESFLVFFIIFLAFGFVYVLGFSVFLSAKNYKRFSREFLKRLTRHKRMVSFIALFGGLFIFLGFFQFLFFVFGIWVLLLPFFYVYAKAIEEGCMIEEMSVRKITEGDWLYKDIKVGRKVIRASWDGLSKEEISMIRKRYKSVKIKNGIPFVPVFLGSFLIFVIMYLTRGIRGFF